MNNYYFTFGQVHYNNDGQCMKDHWVRVQASSYDRARGLFIEKFTIPFMDRPDRFSFQYDERDFSKLSMFYPKGEFMVISE